jgi:hypothetical protein
MMRRTRVASARASQRLEGRRGSKVGRDTGKSE